MDRSLTSDTSAQAGSVATNVSAALLPPEVGVNPQRQYWPLPPAGQTYWWRYFWSDGYNYRCTGPLGAGLAGLVAQNLHDGAFRSSLVGYEELLSISFFKSVDCIYWFPNRQEVLRWYCRGYRSWYRDSDLIANVLSFRGHSRWCIERGDSTVLRKDATTTHSINGRYTVASCTDPNTGITYPSPPLVNGTRYGLAFANGNPAYANNLPSYASLPDRPLNIDVSATTTYRSIGSGPQGWRNTRDSHPTGEPSIGIDQGILWFVSWKDVPGYTYAGKKVQYAGFSEPGLQPNSVGVCEEWWFAEDIGPIYIITYPNVTLAQSKALLYGTSVYPNPALNQSPEAHIQRRLDTMVGVLTLTDYSINGAGSVHY